MSVVYGEDTIITAKAELDSPVIVEDGVTLQISNSTLVGNGDDIRVYVADVVFATYDTTPISFYFP
jgi:hypothetical protein